MIVLLYGATHLFPSHPMEPCQGVTDGIDSHMPHVQSARGIGEH